MILNYSQIFLIRFPVYLLPSGNWYRQDGLLFLDNQIVDDKNQTGTSLGQRRVQTPHRNLLPLTKMVTDHLGIIKQRSLSCFIDSDGKPFIYEKIRMCALKYYRIKEVDLRITASVLRLQGVKRRFIIPRPPDPAFRWAGVLHLHDTPWMLYDYAIDRKKDCRRKV